ncbi:tail spike protein [Bacillus phage Moonbeam]|uniref:Tail spike protein n=1 Tax=Bacillus phage Moonbeam TaxID=1540091 RepID=A0A0A0RNC0_9CAUD|nr:tail spike protein [Bacillus phage Moonbeam]AIW03482.1 tail spike protein [Bacillus phage Moonbeam]
MADEITYAKFLLRRGNKQDLTELDTAEPALATDTKQLLIGSAEGNIELANQSSVDALATKEAKNAQDISSLKDGQQTTNTALNEVKNQVNDYSDNIQGLTNAVSSTNDRVAANIDEINELKTKTDTTNQTVNSLSGSLSSVKKEIDDAKGAGTLKEKLDGLGKSRRRQLLTATVEGQKVFTITNGAYVVGSETLDVVVGTVPQPPTSYTETSSTSITLSEGVPLGTKVLLYWLEGKVPVQFGHNTTHYEDGQDPIDITKLKNYNSTVGNVIARSEGVLNVKELGSIGDGVAKEAGFFQKALNTIRDLGGGKVVVPRGRYLIDAPLQVYKNTTIDLDKDAELITDSAGTASNMFINGEFKNNSYALGYNGNSNIAIRGGVLNVNQLTRTAASFAHAKNILFENITFKNVVDNHFVELSAMKDVTFRKCRFLNFKNVDTANRNYVEAIQIDTSTASAFPAFGGYDNTVVDNVLVEDCYFGSDETAPAGFGAVAVGVGSHGSVVGGWNRNITIKDCVFDGMTYCGVRAAKWNDTLIHNNKFYNCARGVLFEFTNSNYETYRGVEITKNKFYGCGSAADTVKVAGNATASVEEVHIEDNRFYNAASPAYNYIYVSYANNTWVESNFGSNARRLFYAYKVTNLSYEKNKGNTLAYNSAYISNCNDVSLDGNMFSGMGHQGLLLEACKGGVIRDNIMTDCAVDNGAIQLYSVCTDFIVHDNVVKTGSLNTLALYGLFITADSTNIRHYNNVLKGSTGPVNTAVQGQVTMTNANGAIVNVKANASNQLIITQE